MSTTSAGRRRTTRDRQREETRERVFNAALEVFRREGLSDARIEDIAEAAGVSRGTFYFHFPKREDVLFELLRRSQGDLADRLDGLPAGTPIRDVLLTVSHHMADRWESDPMLLIEMGRVALGRARGDLQVQADQHPGLAALLPRFASGIERGELDTLLPPALLASFFLINIFAASMAWAQHRAGPLRQVLDPVVVFFLRGAARPDAAPTA
ncbi:MAG: TetR/AcrR family transcriptional regulator [Alphaproteobacteria bacterium]|nr:TetR/AcrR family transcriptional regulator [Alphaproteobacteria bacterium]